MNFHEQFPGSGQGKQHPWLMSALQELGAHRILDYGAGKGGTTQWLRRLGFDCTAYDPHWEPNRNPRALEQEYDVVFTQDVLEHIELAEMPWSVFSRCAPRSLHIIDLTPAKKRLRDGRNAHITLLTAQEWCQHLEQHLGKIQHQHLDHQPDPNFTTRTRLCAHIEHWQ